MRLFRFLAPGCSLLILPLVGCPSQQGNAPSAPAQATAPAVPAQQPVAPVQAQPTTAQQQRVHQLIAQVEAAYTRGEGDYRRGQLVDAKREFDRAVDLMLTSGIDIRANSELSDEFDKIVDQVNGIEAEVLKQGNGFVPKEEITPAEAASDVTFAVDPNLVAKAQADLATTKSDLPLMVNEYVAAFINFFAYTQKGHNTLMHSFQRSGRYRAMIQRVMAEEGVPQDLIYLAVAESGFQPRAINGGSHAGGMWQFMPSGNYGLTRNQYVDERFDPEKSTRAYARYMKFLYDQLGDWYLAMAAYDWGAGNVQRAVQKTGYGDFWELYRRHNLPAETQNYVPEILAAIIIANHPEQYGFTDIALDPPLLTDTVTVNDSVDLRLVADLTGAPVDELEALNPSLLRRMTPPDTAFDLHLPAGTATLFTERLALIPEGKRNSWRYHAIVAGDTMESVARTYHVSETDLASANQLSESESLAGKEGLVVPATPAPEVAPLAMARAARVYVARRGDTLVTIADRFGVSLSQLRLWNGIASGIRVAPGHKLHVAEPVGRSSSSAASSSSSRRGSKKGRRSASASADEASSEDKASSGSKRERGEKHGSKAHGPRASQESKSAKSAPEASHSSSHKSEKSMKPAKSSTPTHTKSRSRR